MQLEQTLLGRAVRLMRVEGGVTKSVHGLLLARACEQRYEFFQGPRTVDEFKLEKGVTFLHGAFAGGVVEKFQVFKDGFVAEATADTDYVDAFLDDVIGWLRAEVGLITTGADQSPRFYYSNLEIKGDFSLNDKLDKLAAVGQFMTSQLREYRQSPPEPIQLVGLAFAHSAGTDPVFRFERRAGIAEAGKLYHSAAPLRTQDHMVLLEQLERALG